MKSVMSASHSFANVPRANIQRSSFDRSHGVKLTMDADYLIPVLVDDVMPGDSFNVDMTFFARLATPLYPIMDNMFFESFFFFCPYRLVWENWERMHGAQDDPNDSIDFTVPVLGTSGAVDLGDLADYMGLPLGLGVGTTTDINALPFRAYRKIWNEWFRDQNLQDSVSCPTDNGPDTNGEVGFSDAPLKRGKRHDYFTGCLPAPQKGDAVSIPLGTSAEIYSTAASLADIRVLDGVGSTTESNLNAASTNLRGGTSGLTATGVNLLADLSNATAATINDLRLAFQTQRLLERDARSGTRYNELILAHFGVTVPDFRVQRPEFLGGGSSGINVSAVAQTSGQPTPAADDKLGQLAAVGTVSGTHGFTKSFTEHGLVMGLVNVRGDLTYSQGVERYWQKSTRYDFVYPVLTQIGEQEVLRQEIYHDAAGAGNTNVFGYQERYAEYRYKPSRLCGLMRPTATGSLSAWTISEEFTSAPTLGDTFIQSNLSAPLDNAIQVPSEPHFIVDIYFKMICARPMPLYGVPGNLDRF